MIINILQSYKLFHIFFIFVENFSEMTIKKLKELFYQNLSSLYTPNECSELFSIFSEKILGYNKVSLNLFSEEKISPTQEKDFLHSISELKTGKPYQQILGEAYFFGRSFFVNENTLIPRPETEELVELTLSKIKNKNEKINILDIGSGSGCIPITLAHYLPNAQITSIDISEKALEVAKKNNAFHQTKVNFIQKDYLNESLEDTYDIIISNPPYIDTTEETELHYSVKNFEPHLALFAPKNRALAFYEKIAQDCEKHLAQNGLLFLEINQKLGNETLSLFHHLAGKQLVKDLSGNDRFVICKK